MSGRLKPGSPIWTSIPVHDMQRAKKFYSSVLNWTFGDPATSAKDSDPTKMVTFTYPDARLHEAGMGGGGLNLLEKGVDKDQHVTGGNKKTVVSWFCVEDVEDTLNTVEKYGGKRVGKIEEEGSSGLMTLFEDSEGNVLGVYQFRN